MNKKNSQYNVEFEVMAVFFINNIKYDDDSNNKQYQYYYY